MNVNDDQDETNDADDPGLGAEYQFIKHYSVWHWPDLWYWLR